MQQRDFESALRLMRQQSKPRRFVQSIELIVSFKEMDPKKPENQVDLRLNLPYSTGKKGGGKTLLFARDRHFMEEMKGKVDRIVEESEISKIGKKDIDAMANEFDAIAAEGPVMLTVAKFLGQHLAPKGKMPKPVPPSASDALKALKQLGGIVRVTNKKGKGMSCIQLVVGSESMPDGQVAANAFLVADSVVKQLPRKEQNLKAIFLKLSMGPPARVGAKEKENAAEKASEKEKAAVKAPEKDKAAVSAQGKGEAAGKGVHAK